MIEILICIAAFGVLSLITVPLRTVSLISSNIQIWLIILSFAVFILPVAVKYLAAVVNRGRFYKKLKKLCEEKGYSLSDVKNLYKSLFFSCDGKSFTVSGEGKKTYSCKLISCMKKGVPLRLNEDGKSTFTYSFVFAKTELFSFQKHHPYTFEGDGQKILLINPVPAQMSVMMGTQEKPLDNGEKVYNHVVFTCNAFINALERDCADGEGKKNQYKYL